MSYLPILLREDNFPRINFRKVATNRNKKLYLLYLFLNMVKGVFVQSARKPQKIETETKQDASYRECERSRHEGQDKILLLKHPGRQEIGVIL